MDVSSARLSACTWVIHVWKHLPGAKYKCLSPGQVCGVFEKVSVLTRLIRTKISDCGVIVRYSCPHVNDNYTAGATIPAPFVRGQDSLRPTG